MNYRSAFKNYIYRTNLTGSGKANSYVRAIDYLGPILKNNSKDFSQYTNLWQIDSVETLVKLYHYVLEQQKEGDSGIFSQRHKPSYWRSGFYSAALNSYCQFLIEYNYQQKLMAVYDDENIDTFKTEYFDKKIDDRKALLEINSDREGKDVVRETKVRVYHNVFQKKILQIYKNQCCITGLNIPEINRASHIVPWSENKDYRLDPTNGLCLSATYDAAFDRHLISLDEDYRIILSNDVKDHYEKDIVKRYFHNIEGYKIQMPIAFLPDQEHLNWHRQHVV